MKASARSSDAASAGGGREMEKSDRPQDGHKPLGMHISAIRKFLSDHPEVVTKSLTTSQTNRAVVKPETVGTNKPYIEKYRGITDESGVSLIAPATVFVSHAWKYSFADIVVDSMEQHAANEPNAYFWFDLFTNDQNAVASKDFEWFSNTFKGSIREIGKVLIILSPWNSPIPICRAWCLFEIATAFGEEAIESLICLPRKEVVSMSSSVVENSNCLIQALSDIQAEQAEATSEDDKKKIFSVIRQSEGGFPSLNNRVKDSLREWYVGQLQTVTSQSSDPMSLNAVGTIMKEFGFYDKAMECYDKSLENLLKTTGENHPNVATSYNNMAIVYKCKGDLEKALKYYHKSLLIRLMTQGDKHPDVAASLNNIGEVCRAKGDLEQALEYYHKSLEINLCALGDQHPVVAGSYNNMAIVYKTRGKLDKALEYYQKSLAIRITTLGEHHPGVATLYNNMAIVYQNKGAFDKALEYYQKSLSIKLSTLGESHPTVAGTYSNMAEVYCAKGELDVALQYCQKSLSIKLSTLGQHHPEVAGSYNNIAVVYHQKGELEKSLEYYQKALSIRLNTLGEHHPAVASLYNNISKVHRAQGNANLALDFEEKLRVTK